MSKPQTLYEAVENVARPLREIRDEHIFPPIEKLVDWLDKQLRRIK